MLSVSSSRTSTNWPDLTFLPVSWGISVQTPGIGTHPVMLPDVSAPHHGMAYQPTNIGSICPTRSIMGGICPTPSYCATVISPLTLALRRERWAPIRPIVLKSQSSLLPPGLKFATTHTHSHTCPHWFLASCLGFSHPLLAICTSS